MFVHGVSAKTLAANLQSLNLSIFPSLNDSIFQSFNLSKIEDLLRYVSRVGLGSVVPFIKPSELQFLPNKAEHLEVRDASPFHVLLEVGMMRMTNNHTHIGVRCQYSHRGHAAE
jgi:hypothetical protein